VSHAENKLNWCFKKAETELGQDKKHRGLIKVQPDTEVAYQHIKKAEHNLNAIDYFARGEFSDWSISAGFYTIYHCFLALLAKYGYESRNQECIIEDINDRHLLSSSIY